MSETGSISDLPKYDASQTAQRKVTRELGKDEFLKLFVTQMQNQDPMSPAQDGQFIAQLAQFSSLEQLNNINDTLASGMGLSDKLSPLSTLTSINDRLSENQQYNLVLSQTINNTMAAALIDRVATWQTDKIDLGSSGDAQVHYRLEQPAQSVVAKITDAQGQVVQVLSAQSVSAGEHTFAWDGKDASGIRLPAGSYRIEIAAVGAGGTTSIAACQQGRVDGVRYVHGLAYLDVDGKLVPLAEVRELRSE